MKPQPLIVFPPAADWQRRRAIADALDDVAMIEKANALAGMVEFARRARVGDYRHKFHALVTLETQAIEALALLRAPRLNLPALRRLVEAAALVLDGLDRPVSEHPDDCACFTASAAKAAAKMAEDWRAHTAAKPASDGDFASRKRRRK